MRRCGERFQKQPIDGRVQIVEGGQIDLPIPAKKELEVGDEAIGKSRRNGDVRLGGAPEQAGSSISGSHARQRIRPQAEWTGRSM